MTTTPRPHPVALMAVGACVGLLSGAFGIGGGVVLVPILVTFFSYGHRLAAGTSVAAILPAAVVGGATYGAQGHVSWLAALALALGVVLGAQLGSLLLQRLPLRLLRWLFLGFLLVSIISLWLVVPQRGDEISITLLTFTLLTLTGAITGILSGLLGVGGGVIVVPALMFLFGASDLEAKGTSLIMLIPGSLSGTLGNARRNNVDIRSVVILGSVAALFSPLGAFLAGGLTPFWSNISFSVLLSVILLQLFLREIRSRNR